MTNRFQQSAPPSIHDVYRGLPIGPGGVEPFAYRDRGRKTRPPVRLPWRSAGMLFRRITQLFRGAGHRPVASPSVCCQRA